MVKRCIISILMALCLLVSPAPPAAAESGSAVVGMSIVVRGYEWGPGVSAVLLELADEVSSVSAEDCRVTTAAIERTVTDIYLTDANSNRVEGPSRYAAIELTAVNRTAASPFKLDGRTGHSRWDDTYRVTVEAETFVLDGAIVPLALDEDCISDRICPDTDLFAFRDTFTGGYVNPSTGEEELQTLQMAAYEPAALSGGEKNPLLVWLHGQSEGGTDVDVALLGNEVTALAREEIQSYFTAGNETGAYVLVLQCETYWMDEGDGTNGDGSGVSRYGDILMDAITHYAESNGDVDGNRIYLGGCSNGGYMVMHSIIEHPDYFAAAFPVCEAYGGSFTEEELAAIRDMPIWMTTAYGDPTVPPERYTLPAYRALVQAGGGNCWLSMFGSVVGTDSPDSHYSAHMSWIWLLNNQVTGVQDREAIAASTDFETFGTVPSNAGGGLLPADGFGNIFAWMNAQSR